MGDTEGREDLNMIKMPQKSIKIENKFFLKVCSNRTFWLFKILSYAYSSYKILITIGIVNWEDMEFQRLMISFAKSESEGAVPTEN